MPTRYKKTRRGFTLVEILVVLTVIAILVAMLLPAIGAARAVAQGVVCQSNQKQYYAAFDVYAYDFKQYFPPTYPQGDPLPFVPTIPAAECVSWPRQMDNKKYFPPVLKDPVGPEWAGNLMGIHMCPALNIQTAAVTTTSYGMNYWLHFVSFDMLNRYRMGSGPATSQILYSFRREWLRSPNSDTLLFGDIRSNYYFPTIGHNYDPTLSQSDFRHANSSINITYLDGHGVNMKGTNPDLYVNSNRLWNLYWYNTNYQQ